ncbi:WEB family protein-like [Dorcoceras hygrometricum]|uniref:WEB family protein-like n=1 Tax=Dorcoceras hygrometricum TaxID=472368 RepID=A0A2Z7DGS5_9LAMI|nr:WEB family protein-like [Dorcoceras hygrometricum]
MDVKRANELQRSSENAASDAIFELNKVKGSMALLEVRIVDQTAHTDLLEIEIKQLKTELGKAKEELGRLSEHVEALTTELESSKEKENDAQVEIAMLKFEVHKAKSKLAASEIEKSALFNALQDMGLELEERKRENRVLREEVEMVRQSENGSTSSECRMLIKIGDVNDNPLAETWNQSANELENVKKELETAISKVGEFRNRAEQAISRAEAAEKAKAELELQIKKMKEHKERRKAALLALREESVSRDFGGGTKYDHSATTYQTLGKVLKLKF